MTEVTAEPSPLRSAGTLLREARQAQGVHIAALAATIKVAQRKLEALEADRFDELPDATFTRALAQTVCRALKVDPAPVLALLPAPAGHRLEQVGEGINAPFRDRPGRHEPSDWSVLASPAVWGPLLLLAAAAAVYLMPAGWLASLQPAPAASSPTGAPVVAVESAASAPAVVLMPPTPATDAASPSAAEVASAPMGVAAPSSASAPAQAAPRDTAAAGAGSGAGALQVRTKEQSWVEVQDARSRILIARMLQPGEIVALDGQAPLRLKVGNAGATDVIFRGQPVDLAPSTRDNVARVELK
jgi:cytoskeleton protein RodZ